MSEYARSVGRQSKAFGVRIAGLDIELTERCDNDCVHCCINLPLDDHDARARELSTAQITSILEQAAELGCLDVRFTGGEPLVRRDFEDLYLKARRLGMRVVVFTNARRLTPGLAGLMARVPPLLPVEVSVYGMRAESYEAVTRSPGSYTEFRRGVDLLLEHGVPFVVKGVLLPPTRDEVDEFRTWAASLPAMSEAPGIAMFYDLRSRRDDARKNATIRALRATPDEGLAVLADGPDDHRRRLLDFARRFAGPTGDVLFSCGAGNGVSVDAYGRAQPCMGVRAPELTVAIVGAGAATLAQALEQFETLGALRATDPEYLRRCARCFLKGICEQCPAASWTESGTLDTPVEYLCQVAHAQAREMGWLAAEERSWEVADWRERLGRGESGD